MPDNKATTTDWRIVGVSGDTIDGRLINAQELEEMAAQYDPEIYGARINLEHVNFLLPDYAGGYGDVLELKTEPWHKDPSKTALLAKFTTTHKLEQLETPPAQPAVEQPQDYSQTIAELRQEYQTAGELVQKLLDKQEADGKAYNELAANHEKLRQEFDNLKQRLETEPAAGERQEHTGGGDTAVVNW